MKKRELGLVLDATRRPCYVSDCRSGMVPDDGKLCCHEHRRFEHLAEFNTRLDEIVIAAALEMELQPAETPN